MVLCLEEKGVGYVCYSCYGFLQGSETGGGVSGGGLVDGELGFLLGGALGDLLVGCGCSRMPRCGKRNIVSIIQFYIFLSRASSIHQLREP